MPSRHASPALQAQLRGVRPQRRDDEADVLVEIDAIAIQRES